jgi:putative transposase
MSAEVSPATERRYGIQRVCRVWRVPRSTVYAKRQPSALGTPTRGPQGAVDDDKLLVAIRQDLAESPFVGEGHRKVWARLRVQRGVRVSRKRLLRVMRENQLLSPHRVPKGAPSLHDGRITTDAPNVMWGTDGARVATVEDGYVWIFVAVEHWSTECVGFHVCKEGTRYAALEPIAMGLQRIFGSTHVDVARGLAVRHDHGTQYVSDHFQRQLRFWGIAPSYAFVGEPQTNGVAERFIRTMKEQVIHGRIYRNIEELRRAVAAFVERYNAQWLVEKLGFISPNQARQACELRLAA